MTRNSITLTCIVLIAAALRLFFLGDIPPSLYWDEVSQAYNAYSILETGYDEHGEAYPLARFIAFGDYKAPVLIYLMVPSLALFGHTAFAVRLPSALLGTSTVLVTYFLVHELFRLNGGEKKTPTRQPYSRYISLISSFLLAISPWHIQLSRGAYEGNIAQFFMVTGIWLFFRSIRTRSWLLILSGVSCVVSMYSFNAHRVSMPLVIAALALLFHKQLFAMKKQAVISVVIATILLIPLMQFIQSPEGKLRFHEVNIFTDAAVIEESNRLQDHDDYSTLSRIIHNRRVLYAQSYIKHYLDFFDPVYLFITGDENPRFSSQETGQLYLFMVPLLMLGFYTLFRNRSAFSWSVLAWFILAPVAAATARETPHALRSITYVPLYEIIAAGGFVYSIALVKQYMPKLITAYYATVGGAVFLSVLFFINAYSVHFPRMYAPSWQYGYQEAVEFVHRIESDYDRIYFTDAYGRAHIYIAWYGDIHPDTYRNTITQSRDHAGLYTVHSLGKYVFDMPEHIPGENTHTLYVLSPAEYDGSRKVFHTVTFPNGHDAFLIAE